MGGANSKAENSDALRLCKARKKFIKQAIDSRYAFAAAHVAYVQSLRNIGIALRRFAEAEVLVESSLSTLATELDKTPSHSSYPSPSPSHIAEVLDSPLPTESPLSHPVSRLSYMRSGGTSSVTVRLDPTSNGYVHNGESVTFTMPPPPPPPPEPGSWDFFDPSDESESFRFVGHDVNFDDMGVYRQFSGTKTGFDDGFLEGHMSPELEQKGHKISIDSGNPGNRSSWSLMSNARPIASEGIEGITQNAFDGEVIKPEKERNVNGLPGSPTIRALLEPSSSKRDKSVVKKDIGAAEREDPSEFITHRAKDFLSSIKDIEHRFFRASESGKEVSRMLEANNIWVGYAVATGGSSASDILSALRLACCRGNTALVSHEPAEHSTKVITWKRTASSRSTSSRNPLASASKDDNDDSESDFVEEFCMIAGSHSSTLDRLYAWERKLYDEVKDSESIRKVYDQKCDQLRHQFAKDFSAQVIDKTRAVVKDLHSRIRVALQAVDSISKRIEKMRDDELQPQLVELIQGLIRMWKAMLECHHAQYITISLAYHAKTSTGTPQGDTQRQIMMQLQDEIECFSLSFADWINSHTAYVEALNGWMQNCILQPQERSKGRRAFSPRRVLAPPAFVLCRDWSAGIKSLPSDELSDAIKAFLGDLRDSIRQQGEELQKKQRTVDSSNIGESEVKDDENGDDKSSNLSSIETSLAKVLDQLTKFSEASLKMYEDIRQKSETARTAYSKYGPQRS
ncbi:protein ALTERED PHOSPHATE STARVATION RESPONSE 1-like isoform X1 [Actinidia eriantha]|uniref:protein ALTERED PHOSPHATE STARVATION RESPONSE 1-like isoform X1 n=1 Tax=Actinidia eriantha TaxID=165200 RepID=UPI00258964D9|nr:protein ALTERED PHOSPHATE STARVATION RESPONSE 1-like isoform X1 [Actinidia eriantha]